MSLDITKHPLMEALNREGGGAANLLLIENHTDLSHSNKQWLLTSHKETPGRTLRERHIITYELVLPKGSNPNLITSLYLLASLEEIQKCRTLPNNIMGTQI